ncbi:hypothetical protein [Flavobacterium soli]|uniref:hypothetical protein n=1 Tax=Flavobacterium soli TaxID=344881 RepID=UPI0004150CB4|nr:hypothetical protein [Flavobacterium soli]
MDEIAEISEAAGSIKYLLQAKHLDNFGSLKQVSKFEEEVRELSYEVARFFDEAGRAISKSITQKSRNSVGFKLGEIDDIVKTSGKDSRSIILSHNHPTSTGISADDIKIVINNKLGGIRAVAKDGSNYMLKNIGKMTRDDFTKLTSKIAERVRQKYPKLAKKGSRKGSRKDTLGRPLHKASSKKLAQTLTDELVEELINLKQVEYIKSNNYG